MTSYEQRQSGPEYLYGKTDVNFSELAEAPMQAEAAMQDDLDDFQGSKQELCEHVADLRARNRDLEAFAHMVAHNLKDPLTGMITTADVISHITDLTREELQEYMQLFSSLAFKMNNIIDNLLFYTEVRKAEVPLRPVSMAWVMANVRDRLNFMIKEQGAQIDQPQVWPDAMGYGPWIEEVWANYISNALKYGGRPPRVDLGASAQADGMIRFWTRDNGPGLAPEAQARLFKPFGQNGRLRNRGHGLGLSIVLDIVEKLGGQVGVESELGKGSLFFFTLPAAHGLPDNTFSPRRQISS